MLSVLIALRQAAMWPMSSACYWLIAAPEVCLSIASFARILLVGVSSALVIGLSIQQLARLPLCHHFVSANNMLFLPLKHGMYCCPLCTTGFEQASPLQGFLHADESVVAEQLVAEESQAAARAAAKKAKKKQRQKTKRAQAAEEGAAVQAPDEAERRTTDQADPSSSADPFSSADDTAHAVSDDVSAVLPATPPRLRDTPAAVSPVSPDGQAPGQHLDGPNLAAMFNCPLTKVSLGCCLVKQCSCSAYLPSEYTLCRNLMTVFCLLLHRTGKPGCVALFTSQGPDCVSRTMRVQVLCLAS